MLIKSFANLKHGILESSPYRFKYENNHRTCSAVDKARCIVPRKFGPGFDPGLFPNAQYVPSLSATGVMKLNPFYQETADAMAQILVAPSKSCVMSICISKNN
jgi:hypothetical protein